MYHQLAVPSSRMAWKRTIGRSHSFPNIQSKWFQQCRTSSSFHGCYHVVGLAEEYHPSFSGKRTHHENERQEAISSCMVSYYQDQMPVILRGAVQNDPAMEKWQSLDYLQKAVGEHEMAYVEVGGTYASKNVERPEIPFGQYLQYMELFHERYGSIDPQDEHDSDDHEDFSSLSSLIPILEKYRSDLPQNGPNPEELVYMAQNDLFPTLQTDITIPKFCSEEHGMVGHGKLYCTMLWFGPRGCLSPLHTDPLDNILMQYRGRKRVVLFSPNTEDETSTNQSTTTTTTMTPWHYAGFNGQQSNTSPVNIEDPNLLDQFPRFAHAPTAMVGILHPGDLLYIPSKWWHHVRSLDTSISVNVWWR